MPASSRKKPEETKPAEQISDVSAAAPGTASADVAAKAEEDPAATSKPASEQPVPAEKAAVTTETEENPEVPQDNASPKGKEKARTGRVQSEQDVDTGM